MADEESAAPSVDSLNLNAEDVFQELLLKVGLDEVSATYVADEGGFSTPQEFAQLPPREFPSIWRGLIKGRPNGPGLRLTWGAGRALHGYSFFLLYHKACGIGAPTIVRATHSLDDNSIASWRDYVTDFIAYQETKDNITYAEADKLKDFDKWQAFKESIQTRMHQHRNPSLGTPLSYLLREHEESTDAHLAATYETIESRLIACVELSGDLFRRDSGVLYDYLKTRVVDGDLWTFVQPFDRTRDGRKAWFALLNQAEGPAARSQLVSSAYKTMQTSEYTGTKRFTLAKYIQRHQHAHNVLQDPQNGESLTETKKIEDFLRGIKDPRLSMPIEAIRSSGDFKTFSDVQLHLVSAMNRIVEQDRASGKRQIAAVNGHGGSTSNKGKGKGNRGKGSKNGKGGKHSSPKKSWLRHRSKAEWDALGKQMQERILAARKEKNSGSNPIASAIVKAVSAGVSQGTVTVDGQSISYNVSAMSQEPPPTNGTIPLPGGGTATFQVSALHTAPASEPVPMDVDATDVAAAVPDAPQADRKPKASTPEELQAAREKSAGGQFGRANRKSRKADPRDTQNRQEDSAKRKEPSPNRSVGCIHVAMTSVPAQLPEPTAAPKKKRAQLESLAPFVEPSLAGTVPEGSAYWEVPEPSMAARQRVEAHRLARAAERAKETYEYPALTEAEVAHLGLPVDACHTTSDGDLWTLSHPQAVKLQAFRKEQRRLRHPDAFRFTPEESRLLAARPNIRPDGSWLTQALPTIDGEGGLAVHRIVENFLLLERIQDPKSLTNAQLEAFYPDRLHLIQALGYTWAHLRESGDTKSVAYQHVERTRRRYRRGVGNNVVEDIAAVAAFEAAASLAPFRYIQATYAESLDKAPGLIERAQMAQLAARKARVFPSDDEDSESEAGGSLDRDSTIDEDDEPSMGDISLTDSIDMDAASVSDEN